MTADPYELGMARPARRAISELLPEDVASAAVEFITGPLLETKVFPPMVVQMIGVGEATGAMDAMLNKIADFYDDEVEPVGCADIAVKHVADMQREVDRHRCETGLRARRIEIGKRLHRSRRGIERRPAGLRPIGFRKRQRRQHAIAEELQNFAAP